MTADSPPDSIRTDRGLCREERALNGWCEAHDGGMVAEPIAPGMWHVHSASGNSYAVDTLDGACMCPDFRNRETTCKHIRFAERYLGAFWAIERHARPERIRQRLEDKLDGDLPDFDEYCRMVDEAEAEIKAESPAAATEVEV